MKHPHIMTSSLSLLVDLAAGSLPVILYDAERIYAALNLEAAHLIRAEFSRSGPASTVSSATVSRITAGGFREVEKVAKLSRGRRRRALKN